MVKFATNGPHVKPSKEELKANIDKSLTDLQNQPPVDPPAIPPTTPLDNQQTPPAAPTPPTQPPATPPEIKIEEVRAKKAEDLSEEEKVFVTEHAEELTEEEKVALGVSLPPEPPVNWEGKFKASARDAQIQGYKNKEIAKAIDEANALPEPTEDDLKAEYSDWEDMTPTEQRLAKESLLNKRRWQLLDSATQKFKKVDEWTDKVKAYIADPKILADHPELEGKTEEFEHFASDIQRRDMDFETLILAFAGEQAKKKPAPKTGQMFPAGSGGPKEPPKPVDDRLSPEQAAVLRKTDYKKFKELLKAGKIRNE